MKKFLAMILCFGIVSHAFAGTCREQFADKKSIRTAFGAAATGTSGLATFMMIGSTAGIAILPFIAIGTTVGGGTYWVLSTRKPARLIKLIDQSQSCKGTLISKSYKAYQQSHNDGSQLSKQEFCEEIVRSDIDGSLCPEGTLPSIKEVGRHYID